MGNQIPSQASFHPRERNSVRGRLFTTCGIILTATIFAWIWEFYAFSTCPLLLGAALLTFTLGLLHAVDADHIAAIDNFTRKIIQDGKRPVDVSIFFSPGHSLVVILAHEYHQLVRAMAKFFEVVLQPA